MQNKQYILDTGIFKVMREYYPSTFPNFWAKMDTLVESGLISSVREVKKEIERYGGEQKHLVDWIKRYKEIFTNPTPEEQENIRKIFKNNIFQGLVNKQKILEGGPFADPFVIAKAMTIIGGIVVTTENPAKRDKKGQIQGSRKIPDICEYFQVPCITPKKFMEQQNWKF